MKNSIFIWASIFLLLSPLSVSSQTVSKDTPQKEILEQKGQIDSLRMEVEKVKKDNYEKAMENTNRSIDLANLMIQLLILAVAIMTGFGIFSYIKTGQIRKKVEKESEDMRELKEKMKDDFKQEFEKTVTLRGEIESRKTEAETLMKDINRIYEDVKKMAQDIQKIDREIDDKKRSVEESKTEVSAISYFTEGNRSRSQKEYDVAIEMYKKAIELKPNYANAYINWAMALRRLGKYDEAIEKCKKATGLNPDYARAWYNMACYYSLQNKKVEALENLKKAIQLNSKYKERAKEDEDFKNLWEDEDFKKLVE